MGSEEGRGRCDPGLVAELGGHGDTLTDMLGASTEVRASVHTVATPSLLLQVCSLEDGMDRRLRFSVLRHGLAAVRQPRWVPALTQEGFRVARIPEQVETVTVMMVMMMVSKVLGMLKMARVRSPVEAELEPCHAHISALNCQQLVEGEEECGAPAASPR